MFEIDLPIANAFPAPVLVFTGSENYTVQGNAFTRYNLSVTNRAAYPHSLFRPSPDLPPCGSLANAARTWVDVYNGDTEQRIYGFCALESADDLDRIWFAVPQGTAPPNSVYIMLKDRRCSATYTSNSVTPVATATPPAMTAPVPGSVLSGDTVTFEWSAGDTQVAQWWLYVGSLQGGDDYYNSGSLGTNLFEIVTGLPADGSPVHVRLWYRSGGTWQFIDASYTAATAGNPGITSPRAGSVLSGDTVTFEWTANGSPVAQWWLYVGTSQGRDDLYNSGSLGTRLFETVPGFPVDGSQVFLRLWYRRSGNWEFEDVQYTAATRSDPALTVPTPDSTLAGATVTFVWTANSQPVSQWGLYVGSRQGANDYYDSGSLGTHLSETVTGLPTDGSVVFVRLWYRIGGSWQLNDYQFTAA
jgi:hypothetical protein